MVEDDDHARDPQAGVVELVLGLDRLGRRVIGAVGVEPVGDRAAGGAGEEEEADREQADPTGAAIGEAGEEVEHQATSLASIRSHQSANHWLNSIPPCSTISGRGSSFSIASGSIARS